MASIIRFKIFKISCIRISYEDMKNIFLRFKLRLKKESDAIVTIS